MWIRNKKGSLINLDNGMMIKYVEKDFYDKDDDHVDRKVYICFNYKNEPSYYKEEYDTDEDASKTFDALEAKLTMKEGLFDMNKVGTGLRYH